MSTFSSAVDTLTDLPLQHARQATEAAFEQWLTELLPGVRAAIAQHGFEKGQRLPAFQQFLQQHSESMT